MESGLDYLAARIHAVEDAAGGVQQAARAASVVIGRAPAPMPGPTWFEQEQRRLEAQSAGRSILFSIVELVTPRVLLLLVGGAVVAFVWLSRRARRERARRERELQQALEKLENRARRRHDPLLAFAGNN